MYIKTHSKDGQEQVRGKIDKAKWTGQNHFHFFFIKSNKTLFRKRDNAS